MYVINAAIYYYSLALAFQFVENKMSKRRVISHNIFSLFFRHSVWYVTRRTYAIAIVSTRGEEVFQWRTRDRKQHRWKIYVFVCNLNVKVNRFAVPKIFSIRTYVYVHSSLERRRQRHFAVIDHIDASRQNSKLKFYHTSRSARQRTCMSMYVYDSTEIKNEAFMPLHRTRDISIRIHIDYIRVSVTFLKG